MKLILAFTLLLSHDAYASKLVNAAQGQYFPSFGVGSTQSVAYGVAQGSTAQILASNGSATELVQIVVSSAAYVRPGVNPSAVATDMYIPANTPTVLEILAGSKVSAVQVNSSGSLYVTHLITFPNGN